MDWISVNKPPEESCTCIGVNKYRPYSYYICEFNSYNKLFETVTIGNQRFYDALPLQITHYFKINPVTDE